MRICHNAPSDLGLILMKPFVISRMRRAHCVTGICRASSWNTTVGAEEEPDLDACSWRILINLLMKLQLVYDFVNHFSLCSDGDTYQVQVISFDTANSITIGGIMGGRKHLFRIKSGLYSSCEGAIKHPC